MYCESAVTMTLRGRKSVADNLISLKAQTTRHQSQYIIELINEMCHRRCRLSD
jgi:hypothetical protein